MMGRRLGFVALLVLPVVSSCAFHGFRAEPRFFAARWSPDCDAMLEQERARGSWYVDYASRPYAGFELHPPDGIWVLDVSEFASRGEHTAAEDRSLRSVTLRCAPDDPVTLRAVACLADETEYYGWASSRVRSGTRVFVDASPLAAEGSRGSADAPCELELSIAYGDAEDRAHYEVLLRTGLQAWVDYAHAEPSAAP